MMTMKPMTNARAFTVKPAVLLRLCSVVNMDFVVFEINDEFDRPGWQDLFQARRLTAVDQPKMVDELTEWWTRTIRQVLHAKLDVPKCKNRPGASSLGHA